MSAGKYVADRFQPSLSRLSRRATLPLCRQRSGLFSRDHWKDRIMCRSWSLFKCRWKHLWNKMKLDFGMFAYLHTLIHIALKTQKWFAWKTTECVSLLCLQSGKTIWANMFFMCWSHITSNCCRHWLGSRETWRSPQFLWCSLRHFDLSQQQESSALVIPLWLCWSSPCIFLGCNEQTVFQWVCHNDEDDIEVAWELACFCWHATDQVCE